MDIEEQIAKLQLSGGEEPIIYQATAKKAPQVPPKPNKKPNQDVSKTPLVPRSSNVKKYAEPQYCSTLGGLYSNVPTGKVTLDDAVELQIKKEALEHRKMLLQRKQERDAKKYGNGQIYENYEPKGQQLTYANIAYYNNNNNNNGASPMPNQYRKLSDDLPPPPEPLGMNHDLPTDEFPPPPSPVSSSYSELRQAVTTPTYPPKQYRAPPQQGTYAVMAGNGSDYGIYAPGSSTYESIYEPITPRTPSQMSSRSNYSLYTSYVNGSQMGIDKMAQQGGQKVNEVDALTDLLVQSMESGQELDSFGTCCKCGEKIVGENSGCTAMDRLYHIVCFTCVECQINLQGKPFYALEGKPLCEADYLNTLEKCCVCLKPILERILRATGKPYHPQCFTCVVCHKSLDGIPFTVDATNKIHCIDDFHKKFAPRCCVCRLPILPEPGQDETVRVVALDRSFHINCYKCEDCGLMLSSEAEGRGCYPLDDHVLCKNCNATRVQALTNRMTTEL